MVQYTQQPSTGGMGSSAGLMQANAQMIDQATGALENIFMALKEKRKMRVYEKLMEQPFSSDGLKKAQALSPEIGNMYLNSQKSIIEIEQSLKEGDYEDTVRQIELGNYRNSETLDMADALARVPEADRPALFQMYMENADPENEVMQGAIGALNMWAMNPQTGQPDFSDDKLDVMKTALKPYSARIAEDTAAAAQRAAELKREDGQRHDIQMQELKNQAQKMSRI